MILCDVNVLVYAHREECDRHDEYKAWLEALMRGLVEARVKPYYLHHADLAPGTEHFRTTIEEGQTLMRELKRRASGLAQPAYVLDIPGGYAKADLGAPDIERASSCYRVRDDAGNWHDYEG